MLAEWMLAKGLLPWTLLEMTYRSNRMDRSWMNAHRTSHEYQMGVEGFIAFAKRNVPSKDGKYFCPCVKCVNCIRKSVEDIRGDLICDGINLRYQKWFLPLG